MSRTKRKYTKKSSFRKASRTGQSRVSKKLETSKQYCFDKDSIAKFVAGNSTVANNLTRQFIITTDRDVRLSLIEHLKNLRKKHAWTTPLGVFIAIALTLVTTNPKDYILTAAVWDAIFIVSAIGSLGWLIIAIVYTLVQTWRSETVDDIIENVLGDLTKGQKFQLRELFKKSVE